MSTDIVSEQEAIDDRILNDSIVIRTQIVGQLFKDGKLPDSDEDRKLLLKALEGNDKIALTRKRIRGDGANANKLADAQSIVAAAMIANRESKAKAIVMNNQNTRNVGITDNIPRPVLVPGETDTGTVELNPDDILKD